MVPCRGSDVVWKESAQNKTLKGTLISPQVEESFMIWTNVKYNVMDRWRKVDEKDGEV